MTQKRRKYDLSDMEPGCVYAHERLDKLEPKLDKLDKKLTYFSVGLAILIFLLSQGLIDLTSLVRPANAKQVVASK